jgi:hypothetical protein
MGEGARGRRLDPSGSRWKGKMDVFQEWKDQADRAYMRAEKLLDEEDQMLQETLTCLREIRGHHGQTTAPGKIPIAKAPSRLTGGDRTWEARQAIARLGLSFEI